MAATKRAPSRAPWRSLFQSHIATMPSPEFSLSTVFQSENGNPLPRVRTCQFRNFWAQVNLHEAAKEQLLKKDGSGTENNKNDNDNESDKEGKGSEKGINPPAFESDLLVFTTDIRMGKIGQITSAANEATGSVGGPVEALFWAKQVMKQWRIKGNAIVIGDDGSKSTEQSARKEVRKWMRPREHVTDSKNTLGSSETFGGSTTWSWEKEITAQFANMSPVMRGKFIAITYKVFVLMKKTQNNILPALVQTGIPEKLTFTMAIGHLPCLLFLYMLS